MKIIMLGCGNSTGVPIIGCDCAVCQSDDPKNKRSRVSVWVETLGKSILIDSSPDLRAQALRHQIKRLDAVLYTHEHADHTHGIDDLRSFNYLSDDSLPIYCDSQTYDSIIKRFSYAFDPKPSHWYRPALNAQVLPEAPIHAFDVSGVTAVAFEQHHGPNKTLGFRLGRFAYSTDVDELPEKAFEALKGVEVWIVDCLSEKPSRTHANLAKTLEWIARVKPRRAVLTHMSHDVDYHDIKARLPEGVEPGYDGLVVEI